MNHSYKRKAQEHPMAFQSQSELGRRGGPWIARARGARAFPTLITLAPCLGWFLMAGPLLATETNAVLEIVTPPHGALAAVGEDFQFEVEAAGEEPLTYQWAYSASSSQRPANLSGATNATLLLTNLAPNQTGLYTVTVKDAVGASVSAAAPLTVITEAPRFVFVSGVAGGGQASAWINFQGNGMENAVSFTVGYDPNVVTTPVFSPEDPNVTWDTDISQGSNGLVGLTLRLPEGDRFPQTNHILGALRFDFVMDTDPLRAGLYFTNAPVPLEAQDTGGKSLLLSGLVPALPNFLQDQPKLNPQSGLFEQQIELGNPGATALSNQVITVHGLGVDSLTNAILLYNTHFSTMVDTNFDGLLETPAEGIQLASIAPGEILRVTLEYYVTDHRTEPNPLYGTFLPTGSLIPLPVSGKPSDAELQAVRFVNGAFILQFSTVLSNFYYIHYADSMEDLMDGDKVKIAQPAIQGTGATVQWIDNGPPKTETSPPPDGRYYRLLRIKPRTN